MIVCRKNLQYKQKLQKQYHNKYIKPKSYTSGKKVWLNSKYIKTKQNCKLKLKFFGAFRVLYPVEKQAYKLELLKKWRIHNIFHMSLLEQNTTKKGQVKTTIELNESDSKEYKFEAICDSTVYTRELKGHLLGLYYLVS